MINICCCLRLKSKKASELSQKRSLNGSTGVIGYADSEYVTVEPRDTVWAQLVARKTVRMRTTNVF